MRLQDKLDAFTENAVAKGLPSQAILAKFAKGTKDLIESGQADRAVKAGDAAPMFSLPDAEGAVFDSRSQLAAGPLVVTFYRGAWRPYCNPGPSGAGGGAKRDRIPRRIPCRAVDAERLE